MRAKRRKPKIATKRASRVRGVAENARHARQLEVIRNVLDGKLIGWTEVKPWPCIAPLPVARALGVIPSRLLEELLRLDALALDDKWVDRAEARRVGKRLKAEAKRWRDAEKHMRSAIDLIGTAGWRGPGSRGEGPGDTQLRELPWPGACSSPTGAAIDHIPVSSVLEMIADQVAARAIRAKQTVAHNTDIETLSPKLRVDLSRMRVVKLDELLRAAGWKRIEIADLILADKFWDPEFAVKIAPSHTRTSIEKWIEGQVAKAKKGR